MGKRGLPSPDRADVVAQSFSPRRSMHAVNVDDHAGQRSSRACWGPPARESIHRPVAPDAPSAQPAGMIASGHDPGGRGVFASFAVQPVPRPQAQASRTSTRDEGLARVVQLRCRAAEVPGLLRGPGGARTATSPACRPFPAGRRRMGMVHRTRTAARPVGRRAAARRSRRSTRLRCSRAGTGSTGCGCPVRRGGDPPGGACNPCGSPTP